MKQGFTLIELLLVIAILGIIAYFAVGYLGSYETKTSLDSSAEEISAYLQKARSKSIAQEKNESWGVKFDRDAKGDFYQIYSSGGDSEAKVYLPSGITFKDFVPPQKIQFTKLYGARSDASTINTIEIISLKTGIFNIINVNEEGRIYID